MSGLRLKMMKKDTVILLGVTLDVKAIFNLNKKSLA